MAKENNEDVRLDKWLWAARFFKTRSMAHEAIEGGKVYVDNIRAKPSRSVSIGDEMIITTQRGRFQIVVEQVSSQRGSGAIASKMYRETDESKKQREELAEMHRLAQNAAPDERPNSQDRRLLRRIKERFE
jgi:ribosome-associated heat shock protein Hsp15